MKSKVITLLLLAFYAVGAIAQNERINIRVGFYRFDGYHNTETTGQKSGYGYDLLQLMSNYDNVTYEYYGYDDGWYGCQKMLDDGSIDLLTRMEKTPERLEKYEFSSVNIGNFPNAIYIKSGNKSIKPKKYSTYDGITIGVLEGNEHSRNIDLENFAREKGFTYIKKLYRSTPDLAEALQTNEIDAIMTSSLRSYHDEWIIDTFGEQPVYIVTKKGNKKLINWVNETLEKLDIDYPTWRQVLEQRYYGNQFDKLVLLSEEEEQFVKEAHANNKVFSVTANPDRYPYSYVEDGKMKGIIPDIFTIIAKRINISYEWKAYATQDEYFKAISNKEVEVIVDALSEPSTFEMLGYNITSDYYSAEVACITKHNSSDIKNVGICSRGPYNFKKTHYFLPQYTNIVKFTNHDEHVRAFEDDEVDAIYSYVYQAEYLINNDDRHSMRISYTGLSDEFAIAVGRSVDSRLVRILDKSIRSVDKTEFNAAVNANISNLTETKVSLARIYYDHPSLAVLYIFLICLALVAPVIIIIQIKHRRRLNQSLLEAKTATQAKTEFLSNMSHDIRTPMNGIVGMLDIAEMNENDPEKLKYCHSKIREAAGHLMSLLNDALDMSRIESGKTDLNTEGFNIHTLLNSCVSIIAVQAQERGLTFNTDFKLINHENLVGCTLQLRKILINILGNAVKYSKDNGTILFAVHELTSDANSCRLEFIVEDNGIGISEQFQQHIFEPFTQEDQSARSNFNGTGLGMAITKKLVEQLGGQLTLVSRLGEGSTFTVTLDFEINAYPTPVEERSSMLTDAEKEDAKGLHVLLVEDNELNREIAETRLESLGIVLTCASDGQEAIDVFRENEPGTFDVILMDIMMPVLNGLEATKQIRNMADRPDGKTVPIIAMTANAFDEDIRLSKEAGMNEHLSKPLNMERVVRTTIKFAHENKKKKK